MGSDVAFSGELTFPSGGALSAFLDENIDYAHVTAADPEAAVPEPCAVRSLIDRELLEPAATLDRGFFWAHARTDPARRALSLEGHVERSIYLGDLRDTLLALLHAASRHGAVGDLIEIDPGRSWGTRHAIGDQLARARAASGPVTARQIPEREIAPQMRSARFASIRARLQQASDQLEHERAATPPPPAQPPPPGSYLDHAMRTIAERAFPDARDGLKRVQRRILWALHPDGATAGITAAAIEARVRARHPDPGAVAAALEGLVAQRAGALSLVDASGAVHAPSRMAAEALADLAREDPDAFSDRSASDSRALSLPVPWLLVAGARGIAVGLRCEIAPVPPRAVLAAVRDRLAAPPRSPPELVVARQALVLVGGNPKALDTAALLDEWLAHRRQALARRGVIDVDQRIAADAARWLDGTGAG